MKYSILSFIVLVIYVNVLQAQQNISINLAGQTFTLGNSKEYCITLIDTNYYRINSSDPRHLLLIEKPKTMEGVYKLVGSFAFDKNNKLSVVNRSWNNSYDNNAVNVVSSIIAALSQFAEIDGINCKISKMEMNNPSSSSKIITIKSGGSKIMISITKDAETGEESVSVGESISK